MNRLRSAALLIFAMPFVQGYWVFKYASVQPTRASKLGVGYLFIPIWIMCTAVWAMAWGLFLAFVGLI